MITPSFSLTATERVLPKLALDFTTASLDNRVTFTRALNTATVTNSSGYVVPINADLPRFDYDPITLLCKGLLIEESRVNSLPYSADLDNVLWLKSASSIGVTKITSPSNTLSGQKLIESATNAQHIVYQGPLAFASAVYTMSAYFKAAERTQVYLRLDTSVTTRQAIFDLSAVTATPSAGCTATIQSVGNGWYRGAITLSAAESINNAVLMLGSGGTSIYTGDGTSGAYFWGMQVEAGAFPTSYIPTTTLAVTRNADVAEMTGTNFSDWFNASAGTFFINTNARNANVLLTAGTYTLSANATSLKKYATTYTTDPSATSLSFGKGTIQKVNYYKQTLLSAELAALVA